MPQANLQEFFFSRDSRRRPKLIYLSTYNGTKVKSENFFILLFISRWLAVLYRARESTISLCLFVCMGSFEAAFCAML